MLLHGKCRSIFIYMAYEAIETLKIWIGKQLYIPGKGKEIGTVTMVKEVEEIPPGGDHITRSPLVIRISTNPFGPTSANYIGMPKAGLGVNQWYTYDQVVAANDGILLPEERKDPNDMEGEDWIF